MNVFPTAASATESYPTSADESMASGFYNDLNQSINPSLKANASLPPSLQSARIIRPSPPPPPTESSLSPISPDSDARWIDRDRDIKAPIPGRDTSSQDTTRVLSLFAIARTSLEEDNRAFVHRVYAVEAGISQSKPKGFAGEPFKLPLPSSIRFLFVDILLHTSSNVELISHWHRRLRYDSHNPEPQLVAFKFKVVAPGSCSLAIDFYYERRWLRTIHFEFDAVEQSLLTAISSEE